MWGTIQQIFPYAIAFTIPLLITALGALFSERSGVVNIGLDGLMIVGSFTGAFTVSKLQEAMPGSSLPLWIGLGVAVLVGVLFSLLHAFASINLNADQVISGTAINLFFSKTYATTWLVIAILAISTFLLYKTSFGLRLRACGEHPQAADAAGINVYKMRYIGVMISGAFSSLGGAIILVTYGGEFTGSVAGLGFLALAALIFGQWKPWGILGATLFFGFATTIANVSQIIPSLSAIPPVILKIFPYVVTLIALIVFSKTSQAPKAAGEPYQKDKR